MISREKITLSTLMFLKNTAQNIPFKLETFHEDGSKNFWYDTNYQDSSCGYVIPDNEAVKLSSMIYMLSQKIILETIIYIPKELKTMPKTKI